jgi:serine/threonine-protein kinase
VNEARRYRVLETLGRGGFGTVYRAELIGAGGFAKQVALKVLNSDGALPSEMGLRLRDEARMLGLLRHRAVVGVESLAHLDVGWAVVMEYVPGVDASALVGAGTRPPARVGLEIVEEVASALHAAFEIPSDVTGGPLRLVHRDIKPSNIRVTAQGEVKVLDFGVAKADFHRREAQTRSLLFGSLRYMAPERFEGIDTHEGDVYALGVVLAELLASKEFPEPPKHPARHAAWADAVGREVEEAVGNERPQPAGSDIASLRALVGDMLAFEPRDRPPAREIARRCRSLRVCLPGVWLREWAEAEIPPLVEQVGSRPVDEPGGSILVERSGGVSVHGELASTGEIESASMPRATHEEWGGSVPSAWQSTRVPRKWGGPRTIAGVAAAGTICLLGLVLWSGGRSSPGSPVDPPNDLANPLTGDVANESMQAPESPKTGAEQPATGAEPPALATASAPGTSSSESTRPGRELSASTTGVPGRTRTGASPAGSEAPIAAQATASSSDAAPMDAPAPGATVRLAGDARTVWFEGGAGRFPAGRLAAGAYSIKASFEGPELVNAGSITVRDGEDVQVRCVSQLMQCRRM